MKRHAVAMISVVLFAAIASIGCSADKGEGEKAAEETKPEKAAVEKAAPKKTPAQIERERVEKAVAKLKDANADELKAALEDKSPRVRAQAAAQMGKRRPVEEKLLQALIGILGDAEIRVRIAAINALAAIGEPAVAPLIRHLRSDSPHANRKFSVVRKNKRKGKGKKRSLRSIFVPMRIALEKIGEPAVEPLIEALGSADETLRHNAALALGSMGKKAAVAVKALKKAAKNELAKDRIDALNALFRIAPTDPEVKKTIKRASRDKDEKVGKRAEHLLKRIEKREEKKAARDEAGREEKAGGPEGKPDRQEKAAKAKGAGR
ncbi:MAG: HEAT repeat domain-containing protein [Polyangia bacterium]